MTHPDTRENLQWSRVRGAMVPPTGGSWAGGGGGVAPRITREQVLDQYLELLFPQAKEEAVAPAGTSVTVGSDKSKVQMPKIKTENPQAKAYRRIGTVAPKVVGISRNGTTGPRPSCSAAERP